MADVSDIWNQIEEYDELMRKRVYVDGDLIIINVAYEYPIELSRCDSAEKILSWVLQLTEKTWADPHVIRRFALLAAQKNGIELTMP